MTSSSPRWYVVQTHVHSETKAALNLGRQGFDTYLPRYLKRRRHARRVETVAAPLFPRYLFVMIDRATQPWRSIRSTVGVSHIVCQGDEPAAIGDSVILGIRSREDERGFVKLVTPLRFASGDKVRVLDGAFTACIGLFERMTDHERVSVLLDLLGRKVRVVMELDSIAAA